MKHFISILTGRKGELQSICALILTVLLSQVSPFEYKTYQVGVIKFTTLEGVGFSLSWFFLAAAGWMLNQTFQSQRPDGTRNALYFLSYMLEEELKAFISASIENPTVFSVSSKQLWEPQEGNSVSKYLAASAEISGSRQASPQTATLVVLQRRNAALGCVGSSSPGVSLQPGSASSSTHQQPHRSLSNLFNILFRAVFIILIAGLLCFWSLL